MAAYVQDTSPFVQQFYAVFHFLPEYIQFPFGTEGRYLFTRLQIMFHFLEYPRAAEAGAAYH